MRTIDNYMRIYYSIVTLLYGEDVVIMNKHPDMYVNDSKGFEDKARANFNILLEIFSSTPNWSQQKLADLLRISSTTLRKYRREGSVSLYTTLRLSQLLQLDRSFFNGEKEITKEIEREIRNKLSQITTDDIDLNRCDSSAEDKGNGLAELLKSNISNNKAFDCLDSADLEKIKDLLEKNLIVVNAKIQILDIVKSMED